jgi:NADP-dependent 3-hydroxy acid dehydrogenase YdfG
MPARAFSRDCSRQAGAYPVLAARRADRLEALSRELNGALRTGEERIDIPHGPEQSQLTEIRGS